MSNALEKVAIRILAKYQQTVDDSLEAEREQVSQDYADLLKDYRALREAVIQYTDYWGKGGACQNLTKALEPASSTVTGKLHR
jgi:hypothetical protein